jgi:hypothetical protein
MSSSIGATGSPCSRSLRLPLLLRGLTTEALLGDPCSSLVLGTLELIKPPSNRFSVDAELDCKQTSIHRVGERRHQIHRLQRRVNSPGLVLAPHRAEVRLREVRPSLGGRLSFQDRGQDPGQVSSSVGCVTVRWSEPRFPVVMGVRQFETAPVRSRPGLAMQKVEGSSPFIRFKKNPLRRVFCCQDGLRESQMCPIIWRADVVSTALLRELEDRDVVRSSTPSA